MTKKSKITKAIEEQMKAVAKVKKSPQAPKSKWRYGCVKRTYKTVLPKETFKDTFYELVEVFDQGKMWTAEGVTMAAESKKALIKALKIAIDDLEKYDVIVQRKAVIHRIGKVKEENKFGGPGLKPYSDLRRGRKDLMPLKEMRAKVRREK